MAWKAGGGWAAQGQKFQMQKGAQQQQQQQQHWSAGNKGPNLQPTAAKLAGLQLGGATAGGSSGSAYVCACVGPDAQEVVVKTLIGEYVENSSNHGRKVFKKVLDKNPESVNVYLYYWDGRDGPSFQGWWFGNQLGGTQVWSHNASEAMAPPLGGWKIPWDGAERKSVTVSPKKAEQGQNPMMQDKLKSVQGAVADATKSANTALEEAKRVVGDYTDLEALKAAEQILGPQVPALNDASKRMIENQRGGGGGQSPKEFAAMVASIRTLVQSVNAEVQKVKQSKMKAAQASKNKESEAKDLQAFQEILPEAQERCNLAEDCVEKAVITSDMISAAGEEMDEVKSAVAETEKAVTEAQKALGEARIFLNAKQASTRRYESEGAKKKAADELAKLQKQCQDAQQKLNPLKTVRQDYLQRAAAAKMVTEVLDKLTPAEVEVDRAEEAAHLLSSDNLSQELMKQAEQTCTKAGHELSEALKFIDQKKKAASGIAKEELTKMEERAKASQARLTQLKASQKEATERLAIDVIVKQAEEKIQAVSAAVFKASEEEGPFLMGVEDMELDRTLAAVKACENAAQTANTAVSVARMFVATKLVEAKRFSKGPSAEAIGKLKEYQELLDSQSKKLQELKGNTLVRKKKALMQEAESEVTKAEALVKAVGEKVLPFSNDDEMFKLTAEELKTAAQDTLQAEQDASKALAEVRKFITARQIEAKGTVSGNAEASTELIKYQTRLSSAQTEVNKYKKLVSSVDQRLAAKKIVEEATNRLSNAEDQVKNVVKLVDGLGDEETQEPEDSGEAKAEKNETEDGEAGEGAKEEVTEDGDAEAKPATKEQAKQTEAPEQRKKAIERAAAEAATALKHASRYIELQTRTGAAKEEVAKLLPRIVQAQGDLDKAKEQLRERADKLQVTLMVKESENTVATAEEAVQKVSEAEALLKGDDMPLEEATKALSQIDAAIVGANSSVSGAKTFLAMKRLAVKRMGEATKETTSEILTNLQARVDVVASKLTEIKKCIPERKAATIRKEVQGTLEDVETKAAAAEEVSKTLANVDEMTAEQMREACEKAGTAQAAADTAVTDARNLLLERQRDAKTASGEASIAVVKEISEVLVKIGKMQTAVDAQKKVLRDHEHKFVAQRLLKDATELVDQLEAELKSATEAATPLLEPTSEEGKPSSFTVVVFMQAIFDLLRQHAKSSSKTLKEMFGDMSEKSGKLTEAQFVAYITKLLEMEEHKESFFSDEQQKAVFKRLLETVEVKGAEQPTTVPEATFTEQFRSRHVVTIQVSMTDSLAVKGGKTVRKLEVGEIVECLEEAAKEETVGIMRMKGKAESDGKEGYITLAGNQGTKYLQAYSANEAGQQQIDKTLQKLKESATECLAYLDQKHEELRTVRTGPLAETKSDLQKMKPRVSKVQYAEKDLKKKVAAAQKKLGDTLQIEKQKRQEAVEKKSAQAIQDEVTAAINKVQEDIDKIFPGAEALAKSAGADAADPLKEFSQATSDLEAVVESVEKTLAFAKEKLDMCKGIVKGPLNELRQSLVKDKVKISSFESKCRRQLMLLRDAQKKLANDSHEAVTKLLREHMSQKETTAEALFKQLSKDGADVPIEGVSSFISSLDAASALKPGQLQIGLERYSGGLTKLILLEMLQDFQKCVKEIAVTTSFEVKASKTIRKIQQDELVELLVAGKVDESTGIARARCRVISDGTEGWVTLKGNQGTAFLSKGSKPYYISEEEVAWQIAFASSSAESSRKLKVGEVVEVLEGPRQEPSIEVHRMKGRAKSDGKTGWVTLKDSNDVEYLGTTKMLVCKQSIAVTTTFDIAEGKAIRKLDVGEVLEPIEEEKLDENRKLTRIKVRTKRDDIEGFVTIKGNQGTAYAEPNDKMYICKRSVPLEARMQSGSPSQRTLEAGEVFEASGSPQIDTEEGANRVKGRSMSDGSEGWFTLAKTVSVWSPSYKVSASTTLNDVLEISTAKTIRKLEVGEKLQALATPVPEESTGLLRLRVRAEKDGKIGFATMRGNQGTVFLQHSGASSLLSFHNSSAKAKPAGDSAAASSPAVPPPTRPTPPKTAPPRGR